MKPWSRKWGVPALVFLPVSVACAACGVTASDAAGSDPIPDAGSTGGEGGTGGSMGGSGGAVASGGGGSQNDAASIVDAKEPLDVECNDSSPQAGEEVAPWLQSTGNPVQVWGSCCHSLIHDPTATSGPGADVTFAANGFQKTVPSSVLADIHSNDGTCHRQVLSVVVPDRSGTDWAATEKVTLSLTYSGVTVNLPFIYDD